MRRVMEMEVYGKRSRERPRKRWSDCIKEDMKARGLEEVDARHRVGWRRKIRAADPRTVWEPAG